MKIIKIDGEIGWDTTANGVKHELSQTTGDIRVEISSPGGSVFQGIEIFNALKNYKSGNVEVIITSLAASIASYIALAGDTIKAHDNAVYMIHNAWAFAIGDHHAMVKRASVLEGLSNIIAKKYIEITGKSESEIKKMMDEETFFYGSEMQDAGFVQSIVETEDEKDGSSAKALASEQFNACLVGIRKREEADDFEAAAALLEELEEPKPTAQVSDEEGVTSEAEANASKVNAINARLKQKEKSNG